MFAPVRDAYERGGAWQAAGAFPAVVLGALGSRGLGSTRTNVRVYDSHDANGDLQYVGITKNLAERAAAHRRQKGIEIDEIPGLPPQTNRYQARNVEQALIQRYGLGKLGQGAGHLYWNQVNSISPLNPFYRHRVRQGQKLLRQANYPGF